MIDRQKGRLLFECDACSTVEEFDSRDFHEAWEALKEQGWTVRKIDEAWVHGCPRCGVSL